LGFEWTLTLPDEPPDDSVFIETRIESQDSPLLSIHIPGGEMCHGMRAMESIKAEFGFDLYDPIV
jgi:hypothetical protein